MTFNHPRTEAGVVAAVLNNTDWATDLFDIVEDNKTRTNFFTDPDLAALYTAMVKVASSNDEQVITVDAVIDFLERDVAVLTSEQKPEDKTFTTRSLLALGAAFLVLGGLSYKEYFCFRVFALNLQPIFFVLLWFSWVFHVVWLSTLLSFITGILILVLSIQKWRMPFHFDIGDKTKYQV